jgi:hypothetical protein
MAEVLAFSSAAHAAGADARPRKKAPKRARRKPFNPAAE